MEKFDISVDCLRGCLVLALFYVKLIYRNMCDIFHRHSMIPFRTLSCSHYANGFILQNLFVKMTSEKKEERKKRTHETSEKSPPKTLTYKYRLFSIVFEVLRCCSLSIAYLPLTWQEIAQN